MNSDSESSSSSDHEQKHYTRRQTGPSLFELYANQVEKRQGKRASASSSSSTMLLPDSYATEQLIERIGQQRHWTREMKEGDLCILREHRLMTVGDLRILTPSSWNDIPLLPIVKDCLKHAIVEELGKSSP
jgi:hypothetical protein